MKEIFIQVVHLFNLNKSFLPLYCKIFNSNNDLSLESVFHNIILTFYIYTINEYDEEIPLFVLQYLKLDAILTVIVLYIPQFSFVGYGI